MYKRSPYPSTISPRPHAALALAVAQRSFFYIFLTPLKMTEEELQKLADNLNQELIIIDKELREIAKENPAVRGDFDVQIQDLGSSQEDAAQEAGELDRLQALVTNLEKRRKEIINILGKIKKGEYGRCEACSNDISPARLKAMPVASFCIKCAQNR